MRDHILQEIKRIAAEQSGIPPGQAAFLKATGITQAKWRGIHWLKWSDALVEAGFQANTWQGKHNSAEILLRLAELTKRLGRLPTNAEIKFERKTDPSFPVHSTVANHFPTKASLIQSLLGLADRHQQWAVLRDMIPAAETVVARSDAPIKDGFVYLLRSGAFFKIGRSDNIERRIKEITIALPETVELIHAIRTDDPPGIEAYWHNRFAAKRANGEWFDLDAADVKAFTRRTFQ